MQTIVFLVLMTLASGQQPLITFEPGLELSAAESKALYSAVSDEHPEAIDVRSMEMFGAVALAYGPSKKHSSGACEGSASLYALVDGTWERAPMQFSYAVVNKDRACSANAKQPRILLMLPVPAEDVVAIVESIRSRNIATDEKGKQYDLPLRPDNIIDAMEVKGDQARVLTRDAQGERQTVLLLEHDGEWVVMDAGDELALARE